MILVIQGLVILFCRRSRIHVSPGAACASINRLQEREGAEWITFDILVSILGSTIRLSIPLIFTALAGLFSERAGIFDIGLEGKMLGSAFAAACVAYVTGSAWLGLLAGIAASVALGLVHGFASITNRGNQIVSGVAINFFVAGMTIVLGKAWFGQGGAHAAIDQCGRFAPIILPGAEAIRGVPVIGPLYANVDLRQQPPDLSRVRRRAGVLVDALPDAIRPASARRRRKSGRRRYGGHFGELAALPRGHLRRSPLRLCRDLSVDRAIGSLHQDMSAGKGYIALAALIFAKWKPVPVMFACLLFGFLDALSNFMQGKQVPLIGEVPVQIFQALPYVLTCVLLAGFIGVATPPKAGGVPYTKER